MPSGAQTIIPRLEINATTLHIIPINDDSCLVVALNGSTIPYAAHVRSTIVQQMLASRNRGSTYILDVETPSLTQISKQKPIIRMSRLLITVNKGTIIEKYRDSIAS